MRSDVGDRMGGRLVPASGSLGRVPHFPFRPRHGLTDLLTNPPSFSPSLIFLLVNVPISRLPPAYEIILISQQKYT